MGPTSGCAQLGQVQVSGPLAWARGPPTSWCPYPPNLQSPLPPALAEPLTHDLSHG